MVRMRAFLAALGHDELSCRARTALGAIVLFVPFGWVLLLARWSPVRRALRRLGHKRPEAHDAPASS